MKPRSTHHDADSTIFVTQQSAVIWLVSDCSDIKNHPPHPRTGSLVTLGMCLPSCPPSVRVSPRFICGRHHCPEPHTFLDQLLDAQLDFLNGYYFIFWRNASIRCCFTVFNHFRG